MHFNILQDQLFPVVTRSGARRWVNFAQLAVLDGDDAPTHFDWPRADLNIASYELAIGLASLLFQPQTSEGWFDLWSSPPSPDEVSAEIQRYEHAFNLIGDGPLFMQDHEAFAGDATPVEALLIDTPGANGQKKNADVLTWRGRYKALGLPAAAMALYALQQFAPAGGAGNRTSMRGGGPLTTLLALAGTNGEAAPLWRVILANLPMLAREVPEASLSKALPWMAPTLVSDAASGGRKLSPADPEVHELQTFFGQPRRIRLLVTGEGECPLTGDRGPLVTGFVQKAYGVNYGDAWQHPMTPYRRLKEDGEIFSTKPKSGHFGYRDWIAAVYGSSDGQLAQNSAVLKLAEGRARAFSNAGFSPSLVAGGWAMNNMEAIACLYAVRPLYLGADAERAEDMKLLASSFAGAGEIAHQILRMALRNAHFSDGASVSTDSGLFEQARTTFYERSDSGFHALMGEAFGQDRLDAPVWGKKWHRRLSDDASVIFVALTRNFTADIRTGQRAAAAWSGMKLSFAGHGKLGARLYEGLGLTPPPKGKGSEE